MSFGSSGGAGATAASLETEKLPPELTVVLLVELRDDRGVHLTTPLRKAPVDHVAIDV